MRITGTRTLAALTITVATVAALPLLLCTNPVEPDPLLPELRTMRDTVVAVCDTVRLHVSGTARGTLRYEWTVDGDTSTTHTSTDTAYALRWDTGGAGMHYVAVRALESTGLASTTDTIRLDVRRYAPLVVAPHDTNTWINDSLLLTAAGEDTNGTIVAYRWWVDGDSSIRTTPSPTLACAWGAEEPGPQTVRVVAVDDDGIESAPESLLVTVYLGAPAMPDTVADTTVAVMDTVRFHASATDSNGHIRGFVWSLDDSAALDTTDTGAYPVVWGPDDTGMHSVAVWAFDDDSLGTRIDTFAVTARLYAPTIAAALDTVVAIDDPVRLHASAGDSNGEIHGYIWTFDSVLTCDTTADSCIDVVWERADTGLHRISVQAFDDDGFVSEVDTITVGVRLYAPTLVAGSDTTVAVCDMFAIRTTAQDTNGSILAYVWALDDRPPDTSASPQRELGFEPADTGAHVVRVWAFDDDSVASPTDSVIVHVNLYAPLVSIRSDTTIAINDTIAITADALDSNGTVRGFIWSFDTLSSPDTTDTGCIRHAWGPDDTGEHIVYVRAFDDDDIGSTRDSVGITVKLYAPRLHLPADTTTPIYDTLCICAGATDSNGTIAALVWEMDSDRDSTHDDTACFVFPLTDTGVHMLRVTAVDDDGITLTDSCRITVQRLLPQVSLADDTLTLFINDSAVVSGDASDRNGDVDYCLWRLDDHAVPDTTTACSIAVCFGRADTGWHTLAVEAVDDDTLFSEADTAHIHVALAPPVLDSLPDSLLSPTDTLRLSLSATDPNGTVEMFYLDSGAGGWDDSSGSGELMLVFDGERIVPIVIGVRDDDTLLTTDSLIVFFYNIPPAGVTLVSPRDSVFFWDTDTARTHWPVSFAFAAFDPDGPDDSLSYRFAIGPDAQSLIVVHDNISNAMTVDSVAPGDVHWRLVVIDRYGDSSVTHGMLACVREVRVCFVGHSIIAGTGGDYVNGGMRRGVLDSLSLAAGPFEKVRAVGPMTTGWLLPPEDDSCMARSGAFAYEIYDTLTNYRDVNADYWILMLGVNAHYDLWEQTYSRIIIDSVHYRNVGGETYFLNGLPMPDTVTGPHPTDSARDHFNVLLDTIASIRQRAGWQVYVVDAFTALSIDSVFNDSLFADHLHPNQRGYERLVETIMARMRNH